MASRLLIHTASPSRGLFSTEPRELSPVVAWFGAEGGGGIQGGIQAARRGEDLG